MAARTDRADATAADNPTDDHIVGMVVKARAAMARCGEAIGAPREALFGVFWAKYGK
jgi:hypothetical protein